MAVEAKIGELTEREKFVLCYLSPLMEANARMIGERVRKAFPDQGSGSGYVAIGGGLCGRLRTLGLIYKIYDLNAWRLTENGRTIATHLLALASPQRDGV